MKSISCRKSLVESRNATLLLVIIFWMFFGVTSSVVIIRFEYLWYVCGYLTFIMASIGTLELLCFFFGRLWTDWSYRMTLNHGIILQTSTELMKHVGVKSTKYELQVSINLIIVIVLRRSKSDVISIILWVVFWALEVATLTFWFPLIADWEMWTFVNYFRKIYPIESFLSFLEVSRRP